MTATERSLMKGGYSIVNYHQQHTRLEECRNEIKVRLLINNIVSSALQDWNEDFRTLSLSEMRGVARIVMDTKEGPQDTSTIEVEDFLRFQEGYRRKALEVLEGIWHRGAVVIVKKFKAMRIRDGRR